MSPPDGTTVASALGPLVEALLGATPPVRIEFWDGSALGAGDAAAGSLVVRSPDAVRRIVWSPGELGLARAFVAGDLDAEGDLFEPVADAPGDFPARPPPAPPPAPANSRGAGCGTAGGRARPAVAAPARGVPASRPAPLAGPRRPRREPPLRRGQRLLPAGARPDHDLLVRPVRHTTSATLEEAQAAKHELICRKLGLDRRPGQRSCSTSAADGARWPSTPPAITTPRSPASPSAASRPTKPAGGWPRQGWPTGSRSGCRTTATSAASSSTPSPRSACSSTSAPRRHGPRTSRRSPGPSWSPPAACSTTPSPSRAGRCSDGTPSSVATSSPTAS